MMARRFEIDDAVAMPAPKGPSPGAALEGRVVATADLDGRRQKLWIRGPDDRIRMAVFELESLAEANQPTGRLCGPPVDVPGADSLARRILLGRTVRLPVELQLTTLATAVLQADRPNEEGETT